MSNNDLCEVNCIDHVKVGAIRSRLLSGTEITRLSETFRLLGDPTRVRIIHALSLEELCVCDIAALLGTTKSAVSHQLRLLRTMRVVRYRKTGKIVYYTLDDDHVRSLLQAGCDHILECTADRGKRS